MHEKRVVGMQTVGREGFWLKQAEAWKYKERKFSSSKTGRVNTDERYENPKI